MARLKSRIQREKLSLKISSHAIKYIRVKASVLGVNTNILLEDALTKLLERTQNMGRLDVHSLIYNPIKIKRIPMATMIKGSILEQIRDMAYKLDVYVAEIFEAAIDEVVHLDVADVRAGRLNSTTIEQAALEFIITKIQIGNTYIPEIEKKLKEVEEKQQDNPTE